MNNLKLKPIVLNNSKQELNFQRLNYSKIKRELKWKPKTDIDIGLRKTIDWYVKFYKFLKKLIYLFIFFGRYFKKCTLLRLE